MHTGATGNLIVIAARAVGGAKSKRRKQSEECKKLNSDHVEVLSMKVL